MSMAARVARICGCDCDPPTIKANNPVSTITSNACHRRACPRVSGSLAEMAVGCWDSSGKGRSVIFPEYATESELGTFHR